MESKDVSAETSWIPTTPAKPGLTPVNSICKSEQENEPDQAKSLNISNEDNGLGSNTQTCEETGNVHNLLPLENDKDNKLSKMSFKDLLAIVQAANDTGAAANASAQAAFNAICVSHMKGGGSICSRVPTDRNSSPGMADATSSSNISFQFSPVTPDQTRRRCEGQVSETMTPVPGDVQENGKENELQKKEQPEVIYVSSDDSDLRENHKPDNGNRLGTEPHKTPQQRQRRKKHRPKVVIEGKPKRTYKPRTPKKSGEGEIQTGKRKYIRRKVNDPAVASLDTGSNAMDPESKPPGSNETPKSKRKYVRKNGVNKSDVAPSDEGSNAVDPVTPGSNETSKSKRRRVRTKGDNKSAVAPSEEGSNAVDPVTESPGSNETQKSKRKCVQGKGDSESAVTPSGDGSNAIDPLPETPGSDETPKRKRKRVRRKADTKSAVAPSDEGSNALDPLTESPGSNEPPKRKRKYVRRKGVDKSAVTPSGEVSNIIDLDSKSNGSNETPIGNLDCVQIKEVDKSPVDHIEKGSCGTKTAKTVSRPRKSCRKQLNFQPEEPVMDDNSTQSSTNIDECKVDQSMSTVQLGQHRHTNVEMPEVRTPYSHLERQTPEPSMDWNTRGEFKIFSSNGDRNPPNITGNTSRHGTDNANSPNCTSTLFTQETQAIGSDRLKLCSAGELLFNTIVGKSQYNSLQTYRAILPLELYEKDRTSGMHFPAVSRKRSGKEHTEPSFTQHFSHAANNLQQLKCLQTFVDTGRLKGNMSAGLTQVSHLATLNEVCRQFSTPSREVTSGFGQLPSDPYHTGIKSLEGDSLAVEGKKKPKRKKGKGEEAPDIYAQHQLVRTSNGPLLVQAWSYQSLVDEVVERFKHLDINTECSQLVCYNQNAIVTTNPRFQGANSIVLYQQNGTIVPFGAFGHIRKKRPRAKVELDDETKKVWMLLMQDINSEGIDGTDEDKAKWWEGERQVFHGRVESFIARMRLVQGDRRFSPWKGSVVDSVVGVFLTQNVSDHLSSSAFMSLAAKFPLKSNSSAELHEGSTSIIIEEPENDQIEPNDVLSSQKHVDSVSTQTVEKTELSSLCGSSSFLKLLEMAENPMSHRVHHLESENRTANMSGSNQIKYGDKQDCEGSLETPDHCITEFLPEDNKLQRHSGGHCGHEQSGSSVESSNQVTKQKLAASENIMSCNNHQTEVTKIEEDSGINIETQTGTEESKCIVEVELEGSASSGIQDITEKTGTIDSLKSNHGVVESCSGGNNSQVGNMVDRTSLSPSNEKSKKPGKQIEVDWDSLRQQAQANGKKREKTVNTMDSLDWEAVRLANVGEVAESIKERGMNNVLAGRIKNFLDRLVREHGSLDLEWLRDVPPDKAKEYLLSFKGLGLKSVECVRLLTLHHLAFPVDTNVGRIAVRLGWVPLQPLPESLQLHLLEMYPILESIQKYLWPRLCKLDQETLYELHYHLITFGKVFCTKTKPNCNACPLRGECRHFASAFASARLALPAPEEKGIVSATVNKAAELTSENPICTTNPLQLELPQTNQESVSVAQSGASSSQPIIEEPATPEPIVEVPTTPEIETKPPEIDIEDAYGDDPDEIPRIDLNMKQFAQNLRTIMENNLELTQAEMSKALITLTPQAASIPTPKLKHISRLRTEHYVYELPDSHPLLKELEKREPDDPCSYLLAIWTPGETADSVQPPESHCSSHESGEPCNKETCFACNCIQEAHAQTVRGTLLIPCRTAMRGRFPLNGTYFQVNEVFADHESSVNPIDVPRNWLWNLPRKAVFFGTSIPTIFRGLSTKEIQYCFREGYVCVRGFDQKTRAPRPLMARLHFPASKMNKTNKGNTDETQQKHSQLNNHTRTNSEQK